MYSILYWSKQSPPSEMGTVKSIASCTEVNTQYNTTGVGTKNSIASCTGVNNTPEVGTKKIIASCTGVNNTPVQYIWGGHWKKYSILH